MLLARLRFVLPLAVLTTLTLSQRALAQVAAADSTRWTETDDKDASLAHVLSELSRRVGYTLTEADFVRGEDRALATSRYQRFDQLAAGIPIRNMSVRLWTDKRGHLIQLEARTERPGAQPIAIVDLESIGAEDQGAAITVARAQLALARDRQVRGVEIERVWDGGHLVYAVTIKAARGTHHIDVDALTRDVLKQSYTPYDQAEISVPARVYPVYEEYKGQMLPRRHVRLRYISKQVARTSSDPFAPLRTRQYFYDFHDVVRGEVPADRDAGYWSMAWLRREIETLRSALPLTDNRFDTNGVLLAGRYATINIHPDAFTAFSGVTLPERPSAQALFRYREDTTRDDWEVIPEAAAQGKPLMTRREALERDATRSPTHDAAAYINAGFDELQVYYAINMLFETLRPMGFTDPDLGERPFHAFLFDPDIEMQDNAFYTDDTINFTTYTPRELNMARDNTTIWHELGHGVMDRLMGDRLRLADTGGLSEGMADFVAELVLQAATKDADFPGKDAQRIINETGFFLTNEVHDDGEAYGGAMKSILDLALAKYGRAGLGKVTDLVLETMRLCRDHPGLTAEIWFDRMRFADGRGHRGVRRKGELAPLIDEALAARNFAAEAARGQFTFTYQGREVAAGTPGSRDNEVELELTAGQTATYELEVQARDGDAFKYVWPVEVRVFFNSGPLQGAIDWEGEDTEPKVFVLNGPDDVLRLPLAIKSPCDAINRSDGTCSDFAYVQLWNAGATDPVAKKRFYLRLKPM